MCRIYTLVWRLNFSFTLSFRSLCSCGTYHIVSCHHVTSKQKAPLCCAETLNIDQYLKCGCLVWFHSALGGGKPSRMWLDVNVVTRHFYNKRCHGEWRPLHLLQHGERGLLRARSRETLLGGGWPSVPPHFKPEGKYSAFSLTYL